MIQVFANEYCTPGNTILILGIYDPEMKKVFEFIDSETIFVSDTYDKKFDKNFDKKFDKKFDIISDYKFLPFEEQSFDLIINFTEYSFFEFLKPSGKILMKGEILNGNCYYHLENQTFTVL